MNNLGVIACGAGLQDGLNPCIFMACAVFITLGFWFKRHSFRGGWLRISFVLVFALGVLIFNFGPVQILVFSKFFMIAVKVLNFIFGVGAFILGVVFFKDWVLLKRGLCPEGLDEGLSKPLTSAGFVVIFSTVIAALLLSALATFWPSNNYIMLLGNAAILKGQWQMVLPILLGYVVCVMWPLWFVWAFLSIKHLRPSLLKIVCASIFFTASSILVWVFK